MNLTQNGGELQKDKQFMYTTSGTRIKFSYIPFSFENRITSI